MQRNNDVLKTILANIEENATRYSPAIINVKNFKVSYEELRYHCQLILDKGLSTGCELQDDMWGFGPLTWAGEDFLANSQDCIAWRKACRAAGDRSWSVFQNILEEAVTLHAMEILEKADV